MSKQAIATVCTRFFVVPLEVFFDGVGNMMRRFMDKFNIGERIIGLVFLLVLMIVIVLTVVFAWTRSPAQPVFISPTPQQLLHIPEQAQAQQILQLQQLNQQLVQQLRLQEPKLPTEALLLRRHHSAPSRTDLEMAHSQQMISGPVTVPFHTTTPFNMPLTRTSPLADPATTPLSSSASVPFSFPATAHGGRSIVEEVSDDDADAEVKVARALGDHDMKAASPSASNVHGARSLSSQEQH